jgi:hypothetical protein
MLMQPVCQVQFVLADVKQAQLADLSKLHSSALGMLPAFCL